MRSSPTFSQLVIALAILSAVFLVVERVLGKDRGQPAFRRGFLTDFT